MLPSCSKRLGAAVLLLLLVPSLFAITDGQKKRFDRLLARIHSLAREIDAVRVPSSGPELSYFSTLEMGFQAADPFMMEKRLKEFRALRGEYVAAIAGYLDIQARFEALAAEWDSLASELYGDSNWGNANKNAAASRSYAIRASDYAETRRKELATLDSTISAIADYVAKNPQDTASRFASALACNDFSEALSIAASLPDPNLGKSTSNERWSLLTLAAKSGAVEVVGMLLARGANSAALHLDEWGELVTPLALCGYLSETSASAVASRLLKAGAKIDDRLPSGATAFLYACDHGHSGSLRALSALGADPRATDAEGRGAFHYAARIVDHRATVFGPGRGQVEDPKALRQKLRTLATWNLDINARDLSGESPLGLAIDRLDPAEDAPPQIEAIRAFLESGAAAGLVDGERGQDILGRFLSSRFARSQSATQRYDLILAFLRSGSDAMKPVAGRSSLLAYAIEERMELGPLIGAGADPQKAASRGASLIAFLLQTSYDIDYVVKTIRILAAAGVSVSEPLSDGSTLMIRAAQYDLWVPVLRELVALGASVDAPEGKRPPLAYAIATGSDTAASFLRSKGAKEPEGIRQPTLRKGSRIPPFSIDFGTFFGKDLGVTSFPFKERFVVIFLYGSHSRKLLNEYADLFELQDKANGKVQIILLSTSSPAQTEAQRKSMEEDHIYDYVIGSEPSLKDSALYRDLGRFSFLLPIAVESDTGRIIAYGPEARGKNLWRVASSILGPESP